MTTRDAFNETRERWLAATRVALDGQWTYRYAPSIGGALRRYTCGRLVVTSEFTR